MRPGLPGNGRAAPLRPVGGYHGDRGVWPGQNEAHVSIHLSLDSRLLHNGGAMEKRAAQRLARYLSSLGQSVRVRQHRPRMGAAFYSIEILAPKRRAAKRIRK